MRISELQKIFSKYFKESMNEPWVINEIKKLPEKDRTPEKIESTFQKVVKLAEKYPYQYCLDALDQWWYQDLCAHLNSNFNTKFRYNGEVL